MEFLELNKRSVKAALAKGFSPEKDPEKFIKACTAESDRIWPEWRTHLGDDHQQRSIGWDEWFRM